MASNRVSWESSECPNRLSLAHTHERMVVILNIQFGVQKRLLQSLDFLSKGKKKKCLHKTNETSKRIEYN